MRAHLLTHRRETMLRMHMVVGMLMRGFVMMPIGQIAALPALRVRVPTAERVGQNVKEHVTQHRAGRKAQQRRLFHACASGCGRRWSGNERQEDDGGDRDERGRTDRRDTHPPD
jgi:hypothetical protein